jgi:hypothetical protein
VVNSTFSGNSTSDYGGGGGILIAYGPALQVINSTISGNSAGGGGGLYGPVTFANSIIAGNQAGNPLSATAASADCYGSGSSQGHNLVGSGTGCSRSAPGDFAVDPMTVFTLVLGALADNGGSTRTLSHLRAVQPSAPATWPSVWLHQSTALTSAEPRAPPVLAVTSVLSRSPKSLQL